MYYKVTCRLYPTKVQEEKLLNVCGAVRFVYNYITGKCLDKALKRL